MNYISLIAESAVTLSGGTGSMNAGCVCTAQAMRHMTATRKCLPLQHMHCLEHPTFAAIVMDRSGRP